MSFFETLFNWSKLNELGPDATGYFIMAVVSTLLFLGRLVLASFGGDHVGDHDMHVDMEGMGTEASFHFFSIQSIMAFFMGAGWMGLTCRVDFGWGAAVSAVGATGAGVAMMALASWLTYLTKRLDKKIEYDVKTAVGKAGRVYLTIPEKGQGLGQVEVSISGRRMIKPAASSGPRIEAFADVVVVEVRDNETLVVEARPA